MRKAVSCTAGIHMLVSSWLLIATSFSNITHTGMHLQVEIKPEMVAHYLAEFSITYKPVRHGRPGIGASSTSRFIPLK